MKNLPVLSDSLQYVVIPNTWCLADIVMELELSHIPE
jgi:hypothetical protein